MAKKVKNKLPERIIVSDEQIESEKATVGATLKELRKNAGLSPEKVCEDLNIHRSTLSQDENGKLNTTLNRLIKYAKYYGVDLLK